MLRRTQAPGLQRQARVKQTRLSLSLVWRCSCFKALRVRERVQHLYHDPVVQTGETCCATDMTQYEKGKKNYNLNIHFFLTPKSFDMKFLKTCLSPTFAENFRKECQLCTETLTFHARHHYFGPPCTNQPWLPC